MTNSKTPKSEEQRTCEALRIKMAQKIPVGLLCDFQEWLTLEQDLAYARGRRDEAEAHRAPGQFTAS